MNDITEFFGAPISVYTRAQGIADGFLIDVTERARETGFRWPVAVTSQAWADCVTWTEENNKAKGTCQDEAGRLSDVLNMAFYRMRAAARSGASGFNVRLAFHVMRTPADGRGAMPRKTELCLHVGPGDDAEPVLTIMLPGED
jgi:hypothetical protein